MATLLAGRAAALGQHRHLGLRRRLDTNVIRGDDPGSKVASLATVFLAIAAGAVLLGTVRAGPFRDAPNTSKAAASAAATEAKPAVDRSDLQRLSCRVVSRSDKQPIAGASIDVSYWDDQFACMKSRERPMHKGPARSSCRGMSHRLRFTQRKTGLCPSRESWPETKIRQGLPLTTVHQLEPGSPIGGFVKDEDGQPVAGASVSVAINRGKSSDADIDLPEGSNMSVYGRVSLASQSRPTRRGAGVLRSCPKMPSATPAFGSASRIRTTSATRADTRGASRSRPPAP